MRLPLLLFIYFFAAAVFCGLSQRSKQPSIQYCSTCTGVLASGARSEKAATIPATDGEAAAPPLDPQQVAAAIERASDDDGGDGELSADDSSSDPLPWRDDPLPWRDGGAPSAAASDAERIAALLDSLEISGAPSPRADDDDPQQQQQQQQQQAHFQPLPELEFSGADDPLWAPPDDSDGSNLRDVFDDDDAILLDWDSRSHPSHNSNNDDALDLLEQLEHLTLLDVGDTDDNGDGDDNDNDPFWRNLDADSPAVPVSNNSDNDGNDWSWWWSHCHPCDLPRAEPPPHTGSGQSKRREEEESWWIAAAAAAVLAEQQPQPDNSDDDPEEAWQFWHRQLQLLQQQQQPNSDDSYPFELLDFGNPGEEENSDTHNTNNDNKEKATMQNHTETQQQQPPPPHCAGSPEACAAARPWAAAFANTGNPPRACLGHRERVLGAAFSPCGRYLATASQDSTARVWDAVDNKLVATLRGHSSQHECLRVAWAGFQWESGEGRRSSGGGSNAPHKYLLATGGADGAVHVWGCADPLRDNNSGDSSNSGGWTNCATLDHATFHHARKTASAAKAASESVPEKEDEEDAANENKADDEDKPQIYALQFIDHWQALPNDFRQNDDDNNHAGAAGMANGDGDGETTHRAGNSFLLTSSDDHVHLWETVDHHRRRKKTKAADGAASRQLQFREVVSFYFGPLRAAGYGVRITSVTQDSILNHVVANNSNNNNNNHRGEQEPHDPACPNNSDNSSNRYRFGGERNPHNLIFVFDAAYCPANGLLGVALSDGSLRLVNGRGVCLAVLQLPGCQSHLTSLAWDNHAGGTQLATTVATGHLITWGIEATTTTTTAVPQGGAPDCSSHSLVPGGSGSSESVRATCLAVMEGGHAPGRPLYGAQFLERGDRLLLSWGSDGRLCLWDGQFRGEIDAPLAVLREDESYPVFAVSVSDRKKMAEAASLKRDDDGASQTDEDDDDDKRHMLTIAIAGGGPDGGFLGIPVYLQDVFNLPGNDDGDGKEQQKDSKKAKIEER